LAVDDMKVCSEMKPGSVISRNRGDKERNNENGVKDDQFKS
jgi:hypothetical protein